MAEKGKNSMLESKVVKSYYIMTEGEVSPLKISKEGHFKKERFRYKYLKQLNQIKNEILSLDINIREFGGILHVVWREERDWNWGELISLSISLARNIT